MYIVSFQSNYYIISFLRYCRYIGTYTRYIPAGRIMYNSTVPPRPVGYLRYLRGACIENVGLDEISTWWWGRLPIYLLSASSKIINYYDISIIYIILTSIPIRYLYCYILLHYSCTEYRYRVPQRHSQGGRLVGAVLFIYIILSNYLIYVYSGISNNICSREWGGVSLF